MKNELRILILGSKGAGKTTLLSCIVKSLNETVKITSGNSRAVEELLNVQKIIEEEANKPVLEFSPVIPSTENFSEYFFTVKGKQNNFHAKFYDYPGDWIESNSEKLIELAKNSNVIIAAVDMPYVMESEGKYIDRAKIKELQNIIKISIKDNNGDKLILLTPIKSEAYIKDNERIYNQVEKVFNEVSELAKNSDNIALAIVPVKTLGNVKFNRFGFSSDEIIYLKPFNSKFSPENTEQPLKIALKFFLNHFELSEDLKKISDLLQKEINFDGIKILSGEGLIDGTGIKQKFSFEENPPEPEIIEDDIKIDVKPNKGSKYKIAVMGATGVGKTIFLGSYFNLVTVSGAGEYSIDPSSQKSARKITDLIHRLFSEKIIVTGTSERVDFSFAVNKLNMNIELFDLPGGYTQDMDDWVREKIIPDLLQADGALFFISGEDLVKYPERTWTDNMVFSKAISLIRENIHGEFRGRADVPIHFIITKGDTIPDVTVDELKKLIASLIKKASSSPDTKGIFGKNFFAKGNYVKIYKTESMGKWPSANILPKDYQPKNVTEPMDDLINSMYESRNKHKSIRRKILIGAAAIVLAASWGLLYFVDHERWNTAQENIEHALRRADYSTAQKILEDFKSPSFLSFLYPEFLRADSKINDGYAQYEAALYSLLQSDFTIADKNKLPAMTQDFTDAAERVESYLAVKNFAVIAPSHYDDVKSWQWYFNIGKLFNFDISNASPKELMNVILRCLEQETPSSWESRVNSKIEGLVRAWSNSLPLDVEPKILQSYINTADSLINSPKLSDNTKEFLKSQEKIWRESQNENLKKIADEFIFEAGNNIETAIPILEQHLAENPSKVTAERIKKTLDNYYGKLVEQWLDEYNQETDIQKLKYLSDFYENMPEEAKEKLSEGINALEKKRIDKLSGNIAKIDSIKNFPDELEKLGADFNSEAVKDVIVSTMQGLMKNELDEIRNIVSGYLKDGRFGDGKGDLINRCNSLRKNLRPLASSDDEIKTMMLPVDEFEKTLTAEIQNSHLNHCRQEFNLSKNTRNIGEISECIKNLNNFLRVWPDSKDSETVKDVLNFLTTIQNGVQGKIQIVQGNFTKMKRWNDTPDVYIVITENKKQLFKSRVFNDSVRPVFGDSISYTWKINNPPLVFAAYDKNIGGDKQLLSQQINVSGFFGYENLNATLTRYEGCSLQINFSGSIPKCAWN